MIFEKQIGVSIEISACIGAIILVLVGVLSEKEALASIDLKVVFLFGGSLTLAKALDTTGAGELIADKIVGLLGADPNPIVLLLVIFIVTCALTNFMSNTATTALMLSLIHSYEFYEAMRNGSMPTTAQVNPENAKALLEPYRCV